MALHLGQCGMVGLQGYGGMHKGGMASVGKGGAKRQC
jgi:hypothetical protein